MLKTENLKLKINHYNVKLKTKHQTLETNEKILINYKLKNYN